MVLYLNFDCENSDELLQVYTVSGKLSRQLAQVVDRKAGVCPFFLTLNRVVRAKGMCWD